MASSPPTPGNTRPIQGIERLWLAAERIQPGFVISLVIEGESSDVPALQARLERAVAASMLFHPGFQLRLQGFGRWLRGGIDGPVPPVRVVVSDWSGMAPDTTVEAPLDPEGNGPDAARRRGVEVVIVPGPPVRLLFRVHHAFGDARALFAWTRAVFTLLRDEVPPATTALPRDAVWLGTLQAGAAAPTPWSPSAPPGGEGKPLPWSPSPRDQPTLLGACEDPALRTTWARVRVATDPRDILVRVLIALRRIAPAGSDRIGLPVDLRAPGMVVDGNLTGIATLTLPAEDEAQRDRLRAAIQAARQPASCGGILRFADGIRDLPLAFLAASGRRAAQEQLAAGRFESLATVSNLGRMDLSGWSGGGFRATRAWVIPPGSPGNPFFLDLNGDAEGADLLAAAPVGLASGGRLEAALHALVAALPD